MKVTSSRAARLVGEVETDPQLQIRRLKPGEI
jgi:hypothetical protein